MMRVAFFGTPAFAATTLRFLIAHEANVVGVVTQSPKPKGRSGTPLPSPTHVVAQELDLPVLAPLKATDPEFIFQLQRWQADLFIVVAYGKILRPAVLDMPPKGCINVHASLLPKYRGAAPMQRSLMAGDSETGIAIQYMALEMDAGDIIRVAKTPIPDSMNLQQLEEALLAIGSPALVESIHEIEQGTACHTPQDHPMATPAPKIETRECRLDWIRPARELHNLVRGVRRRPGAWTLVELRGREQRMKIDATEVVDRTGKPGQILEYSGDQFIVACGQQALRLTNLQPEGKKVMEAASLMRGLPREAIALR